MSRVAGTLERERPGLRRAGVAGHDGQRAFAPTTTVSALLDGAPVPDGARVSVAGRVGESASDATFHLVDGEARVAVQLESGKVPPAFAWVGLDGRWDVASRGVAAARVLFLRPARRRPGAPVAADLPEARFVADPARLAAVRRRARLLARVRGFLDRRGFVEVQTPFLRAAPETANVHQYRTEAVGGRRLFLRTDPEEYLKRYLTAGLEAVYEVSLNARGEVPDADRLQEFTSLECYRRFATLEDAVALLDELVREVLTAFRGDPETHLHGRPVSFARAPAVRTFADLVAEHTGVVVDEHPTAESLAAEMRRLHGEPGGSARDGLRGNWLERLLEERVLPHLTEPTYVVEFPRELGWSACLHPERPEVCLRSELYLPGGWELAQLYENLTEPEPLRGRLEERLARRIAHGYEAVPLDEGLLGSAEMGMPPMAGFAVGIDRLLMLALGADEIGSGLLFPREGFDGGGP